MARQISSAALVTGLTSAALVGVLLLAVQAGQAAPQNTAARKPAPGASGSPEAKDRTREPAEQPTALPADSGTGKRVVYSLGRDRVWLVDHSGRPVSTFTVWPGNVEPALGTHRVTDRQPSITGNDGVSVENIVYFSGSKEGLPIAFSAAVDGSSPKPVPGKQTGAIRVRTADGDRIWDFTVVGSDVVVVR
ncbi:hypothetical protein [Streptomyces clavuligerus]|uniref:Secreted protein n=1 Tax=Streptomyces clavuligerus TaxID=1901 RepID=B5GNN9_STRCL|nr:hypothetical protein [Streptomyces clavuligerus]ANW18758.1 hypothetical protein BB341_11220 [Streptomyces clavuligerus]AXU13325.1 hypothetical protein D1794_11595 [Streptomyces clavuligerus]EDY47861.1 secreted protein [Streptomyces clavuligerus]EFG08567.1 secreted protein [Streptomyces clavuligerus]MBY6303278.1 hypothetical protein [Streptomyces clavuligerus]